MKLNEIPADLASWADAPFPVQLETTGGTTIILLAAINGRVIGATDYGSANDWSPDGAFKRDGRGSILDLPVPPAQVAAEIERLCAAIMVIEKRLDDNPDAPMVWRHADEVARDGYAAELAKLAPQPAEAG